MKRGRLPLTALRSFESAGRHLSFSRAAEELFVTQAAISRQVRELEETLGRALFQRLHRRVELTEAGEALLGQLTRSFDDIDRRLTAIAAVPDRSVVRVSVEPSFGRAWLVPRLAAFRDLRPDIDVVVDVESRLVEFRAGEADMAIRFGQSRTSWPRVQSSWLADIRLAPAASPELCARLPAPLDASDIARLALLHEDSRRGWAAWFDAAGLDPAAAGQGPVFPDAALAGQAAILGEGIVLADAVLHRQELDDGRLVLLSTRWLACGAYWLVAPDLTGLAEPAAALAAWTRARLAEEGETRP
jgi:LysR family glycine cleavage system transcriptional activator